MKEGGYKEGCRKFGTSRFCVEGGTRGARAVGSVRVEPRGKYKRGLGRRREREQERPWNKDNWARRNNDTGSQL